MKKTLTMVFVLMLMLSNVAMAAGEGNLLTKLQKNAEIMIAMFHGRQDANYAAVSRIMAPEVAKSFSEQRYNDNKKFVSERFGKIQKESFFAFQRMDKADMVVYLATFTKEELVSMDFFFDASGKLVEYQFTPVPKRQNENKKE